MGNVGGIEALEKGIVDNGYKGIAVGAEAGVDGEESRARVRDTKQAGCLGVKGSAVAVGECALRQYGIVGGRP